MPDYLYEVHLEHGRDNDEWQAFFNNVTRLNGKTSGYSGIDSVCVIKHHQPAETVHLICTEGMDNPESVTVEEITANTIRGRHRTWTELVRNYFMPYGSFPHIEG